jgi:uncharacterized RDD family membrane protein YckC
MSAVVDLTLLGGHWFLSGVLLWIWVGALCETSSLLGLCLRKPEIVAGASLIWTVTSGLTGWGYFTLLRAACGRTLGEALWGLRVVREDGTPPGPGDALRRGIGAVLSLIPLGAGYWWTLLDRQGRTWHGVVSHTRVVGTWPPYVMPP